MLNGFRPLLLAAAACLSAAGSAQAPPPQPQRAPQRAPYTTERLSPDIMGRLLAEPIALIGEGHLDEAERAFALQLGDAARRHGPTSLAVGDLTVMFGITLVNARGGPEAHRRGIAYLRRGVAIHAAVLGQGHPEVGLGYSDIGHALWAVDRADPPAEADAMLELGWRIRSAALGRSNVESASALGTLAKVRGLPSRTRGDRARIDASAALFLEAVVDFGRGRVTPGHFGSITTRFDLARMYRSNGLVQEATEAALAAHADYRTNFAGDADMCEMILRHSFSIAAALVRDGYAQQAGRLRDGLDGLPCYEGAAAYGPLIHLILPEDLPPRAAGAPR